MSKFQGGLTSDSEVIKQKRAYYARVTWPEPVKRSRPVVRDSWEAYGIRRKNGGRIEQMRNHVHHGTVPEYIESLYPPREPRYSRLGDNTLEKYMDQVSPDKRRRAPLQLSSQTPLVQLLQLKSDARQPANAAQKRRSTDSHLPRVHKLPPPPFSVFRPPQSTRPGSDRYKSSRSPITPALHTYDISFPRPQSRASDYVHQY